MGLLLCYLFSQCDFSSPVCLPTSQLIKINILRTISQICGGSLKQQYSHELGTASRHPDACLSQSWNRIYQELQNGLGERRRTLAYLSWNENICPFETQLYYMTWDKLHTSLSLKFSICKWGMIKSTTLDCGQH